LFTGREWLSQVGLYDYRNRVYSAQIGRFLQTDPIRFAAGDVNIYRYCGNSATNRVDPWGLDDDLELFKVFKKIAEELFKDKSKSGPLFDVLDLTSAGGKAGAVAEQIKKRTDFLEELNQTNPNEDNSEQLDKKQKDFENASEVAKKVTEINFDPFDKDSYK
jgi:RHS repeat-associated protein